MRLDELTPNEGAKKRRKRKGRGTAAGQGKTAGRGTKGQGARSGGGKGQYFEGGQLPLARRLPFKRGFTNIRKITYKPVNLGRLIEFDFSETEVTPEVMAELGLLKDVDAATFEKEKRPFFHTIQFIDGVLLNLAFKDGGLELDGKIHIPGQAGLTARKG